MLRRKALATLVGGGEGGLSWVSSNPYPTPSHQGAAAQLSPSLLTQLLPGNLLAGLPVWGRNISNLSDYVSTSHKNNPTLETPLCAYSPPVYMGRLSPFLK